MLAAADRQPDPPSHAAARHRSKISKQGDASMDGFASIEADGSLALPLWDQSKAVPASEHSGSGELWRRRDSRPRPQTQRLGRVLPFIRLSDSAECCLISDSATRPSAAAEARREALNEAAGGPVGPHSREPKDTRAARAARARDRVPRAVQCTCALQERRRSCVSTQCLSTQCRADSRENLRGPRLSRLQAVSRVPP